MALDEPINEAFRAGSLTLGWDGGAGRVLVEARAQSEDGEAIDPDGDGGSGDGDRPDLLRVQMSLDAARSSREARWSRRLSRLPCRCAAPARPTGPSARARVETGHYRQRPPTGCPIQLMLQPATRPGRGSAPGWHSSLSAGSCQVVCADHQDVI